jgi:hypothetical protein
MNAELKIMKDHAETFDLIYIKGTKNKSLNVFCSNVTLIKDYLLLKTATTDDLRTLIIMTPSEMKVMMDEFNNKLTNSDLILHCKQRARKDTIDINNGGKIDFIDCNDFEIKLKGLRYDLIYVTNSALDKVFADDSGMVYTLLNDPGRLIYNFNII